MAKRGLSSIQQKAKANGGTGGKKYDKAVLGCKRQLAGPNPDPSKRQARDTSNGGTPVTHTCGEDFLLSYQSSRNASKPRYCEECWQAKHEAQAKKDPMLLALGLIK